MTAQIVFFQLSQKFVNDRESIPDSARKIIYYSLAIGHHVGVLDCFSRLIEIPIEAYAQWLSRLPEGPGRRKLEGVLKWGEIEINHSHASDLLPALNSGKPEMDPSEAHWAEVLIQTLRMMLAEPALYLMARKI